MVVTEAVGERTVFRLPEIVDSLSGQDRERFTRLFGVTTRIGELDAEFVSRKGLQNLQKQQLTRTRNYWDHRITKFNRARAERPQEVFDLSIFRDEIKAKEGKDDFCPGRFETETPPNIFGIVEGLYSVTRANKFAASPKHGVVIFYDHDPLVFPTEEKHVDHFELTEEWFDAVRSWNKEAIFNSYIRNNLANAGASVWFHGHGQLEAETDHHESEAEELRDIFHLYRYQTGRDYFEDLYRAHESVGLGMEMGNLLVFASLTPIKERHLQIFAYEFGEAEKRAFYRLFRAYFQDEGLGAKAYNVAIEYRPEHDTRDWGGFPRAAISLIDRGDPARKNSDIGASELIKRSAVVSSDPNSVIDGLKRGMAA